MATSWFSAAQLKHSLAALKRVHPYFGMTFLAFKARQLPVGTQVRLNFSAVMREFLQKYYRPSTTYSGYYNPFVTSNPSNRWATTKYPSGALQRIAVDTFGDAIIHTKRQSQWGWRDNYVDVLARLQTRTSTVRIPAFHLAVWLYRDQPSPTADELLRTFLAEFHIHSHEHDLFDLEIPSVLSSSARRLSERSLLRIIGWPPGASSGDSITVSALDMKEVGPAPALHYRPAGRLNLITGDNSLGKTFLLECVWWAITGHWNEYAAEPRRDARPSSARLKFSLNASGHDRQFNFRYSHDHRSWLPVATASERSGGLAIYCRHDGSYVIWDPVSSPRQRHPNSDGAVVLDRNDLWRGRTGQNEYGQPVSICNGLLADWVDWQTRSSQFDDIFDTFTRCLHILSPPSGERLQVDDPIRMPGDEQEVPALKMTYGTIPFLHASAGVQRIVGLVYVMIWAWYRHQRNAKLVGRIPQDCLILMVDELEAHLHPRWQRSIVPGLMSAVNALGGELTAQLHVSTHSPLVLASTESVFSHDRDALHHLDIGDDYVDLQEIDFARFGNVDSWLQSDIFGLLHARSVDGERAIERAKALQLSSSPNPSEIRAADDELRRLLRDDDEFWPRWRYFAKRHRGGEA